jgi:hypothetical protein
LRMVSLYVSDLFGGQHRVRTCDPCRVKAVSIVQSGP